MCNFHSVLSAGQHSDNPRTDAPLAAAAAVAAPVGIPAIGDNLPRRLPAETDNSLSMFGRFSKANVPAGAFCSDG